MGKIIKISLATLTMVFLLLMLFVEFRLFTVYNWA